MAGLLGRAREIDEVDNFLDPEFFYEHGENPAYKQLADVIAANSFQGRVPEHRSLIVDNRARLLLARGFDDLLQRDLRVYTSPRALLAFFGASVACANVLGWTNRLLPVGQFGITRLSQTPFYHKFGRFPTLMVVAVPYLALYCWFRVSSFCLRKIWNHVVLQEREYAFEEKRLPYYGEYYFNDTPLADTVSWNKLAKKPLQQHLKAVTPSVPKPTWDV